VSARDAAPATPTPVYFGEFVEGRRGEILDAALAVFAERGYEAGTMRDIASRVGVTEPALYRHYAGKEALLVDLVSMAGQHMSAEADRRLSEVRPETLRESLGNLLHMRRQETSGTKNIMRTLMNAAPHNQALRTTFREGFGRPMVDNVRRFVPHVDSFFEIERSPDELDAKVRAFMSLFVGYFMTSMFFDAPTDDDAIVDAMLCIMGWEGPG
jgi:AcrR family transcriptional regulator